MKVRIEAEIEVPDGAPMEDVEAWLRYNLGEVCQLSGDNAMAGTDLVSVGCERVYVSLVRA